MGWAPAPAPARAGWLAGLALDATRPTGSKESRKEAGFGLAVAPFLDPGREGAPLGVEVGGSSSLSAKWHATV
jgi:hypothetical protein